MKNLINRGRTKIILPPPPPIINLPPAHWGKLLSFAMQLLYNMLQYSTRRHI